MPRRSAQQAAADVNPAAGGVATLDRALSVLTAFTPASPTPTLAEIAARTRLYKSTLLRMLASLEHAHWVVRRADGRWALGAEVERLHRVYAGAFSLEPLVMPVLRALVEQTQESAAFYVRQGDARLCLHRVDSPRPVRDHLKAGDLLPLDRGVGGRVLMAFSGARGPLYARLRRERVLVLVGDRVPELAAIGAPVFQSGAVLAGALTLTMPAERLDRAHAGPVREAARRLSELLGGSWPE